MSENGYIVPEITPAELDELRTETKNLLDDFFLALEEKQNPAAGATPLLVVGCSTSEILGEHIGKSGSEELGKILAEEVIAAAKAHGMQVAAQCCEHLNRSLVVEKEVALSRGLQIVSAVPKPHAGGSFGAAFYLQLKNPVLVEQIAADYGIDIGQTLIGMHIRRVAVPLRLPKPLLGKAIVTAATSRPPLIGGERAQYR
jgi:uncharacterized protein (TIGR01440 family)